VILMALTGLVVPWVVTSLVVHDDELVAADLILVLNGKLRVRASHAARLYHAGLAPRILVAQTEASGPGHGSTHGVPRSTAMAHLLALQGVPRSAVEIIPYRGGVVNTRDEARAIRQYLERQPARRVIVVTTDRHTGRARMVLRQELRGREVDLRISAAPDDNGITPTNWWRSRAGVYAYTGELLKQAGTVLQLDHSGRSAK
jgi:uncharacterized SAM-binding protein YcdF (DUF218 family)